MAGGIGLCKASPLLDGHPDQRPCPVVPPSLQAALISCKSLTLLLLPSHLPTSCLPVAPADTASHLHGVTVLGGREEGGRRGDRGRRRSGAS